MQNRRFIYKNPAAAWLSLACLWVLFMTACAQKQEQAEQTAVPASQLKAKLVYYALPG